MPLHFQWSRVIFRPSIFWSLVAIELLFFGTAVHSLAARFYRIAPGASAVERTDRDGEPAPEETAAGPLRLVNGAPTVAATPLASPDPSEPSDSPPGELAWERIYGDYTLRCYSGGFTNDEYLESQFEIWQHGTLVYSNSNHTFTPPAEEDADGTNVPEWQLPPPGADLTGRGQPDVVIAEYSGGAHCCSTYRSYAPEVILRFAGDHYVIAPELMETPALTEEELADKAAEIQAAYREVDADGEVTLLSPGDWGSGEGELWTAMLELIYGGHEDQALQLFNLAWPEWAADPAAALQHFSETVGASAYWRQLMGEPVPPVE